VKRERIKEKRKKKKNTNTLSNKEGVKAIKYKNIILMQKQEMHI
jgi:hypothetical protein